MARELDQLFWTMFFVGVLRHHYFRADIEELGITTVVTVKTLAFDVKLVETLVVRILYKETTFIIG